MVRGSYEPLRKRVESVLQMALATTGSLVEQYQSGDRHPTQDYEDVRALAAEEGGTEKMITA